MEYEFKPLEVPVLTLRGLRLILEAAGRGERSVEVSLDLGVSRELVRIGGGSVTLRGLKVRLSVLKELLEKTSERDVLALLEEDNLVKIQMYSSGSFYKLRNIEGTAPTLEINGIHMHRIEGVTPWQDAESKIRAAGVRRGSLVLDTATGLGYTAIHAAMRGARVITIERDLNVVEIARYNPWSRRLRDKNITTVLGDATRKIEEFPDSYFTHVIHDPPRFSLSPEMYSEDFYSKMYEKLKPGGALLHYVGEPGRLRGLNLPGRVSSRLKRAGFTRVRYLRGLYCILATRP